MMDGRYTKTNRGLGGFGGLGGYVECSYVELVELFGRPNIGMSRDGKSAFGWLLLQTIGSRKTTIKIYPYKATRDYDKRLPSRAALRRLPTFTWNISGNVDHDVLAACLSRSAEREVNVTR